MKRPYEQLNILFYVQMFYCTGHGFVYWSKGLSSANCTSRHDGKLKQNEPIAIATMAGLLGGVLDGIRGAFDFVSGVNDGNSHIVQFFRLRCDA
jgi:hypothetical protein